MENGSGSWTQAEGAWAEQSTTWEGVSLEQLEDRFGTVGELEAAFPTIGELEVGGAE